MINNTKILWIIVAIVAVISIVAFFNGRTVTQVIENPLGSITSPYFPGPEFCLNELCTYVANGSFKNATTTFVSFANPYTAVATSTIDLVELRNTGVATSTYTVKCGVSYKAGWLVDENQLLISTGDVATSTNFGLIKSGVDNPVGYKLTAQGISVNSVASSSVAFGPGQYFVCKASFYANTDTHAAAFVGTGEAFDGNFKVRIIRGY